MSHPILERLGFQVIGWEDWLLTDSTKPIEDLAKPLPATSGRCPPLP